MHLLKIVIFSLFLTGCSLMQQQLSVPDKVSFQGKTYEKVTDNRIDEMRQMLYLPSDSKKDPEHWQQGILFFLDQNSQGKTLEERVDLRKQSYQQNHNAKVAVEQNELRSQVIYPPTERFNDVLLEVSRGRNLQCGYGQIQVSNKQMISSKKAQHLTAYQDALFQLAQQVAQLPWQIHCQ